MPKQGDHYLIHAWPNVGNEVVPTVSLQGEIEATRRVYLHRVPYQLLFLTVTRPSVGYLHKETVELSADAIALC